MSNKETKQNKKRARRAKRVRARISGSAERPRCAVFRSNAYMYAQLIDDAKGKTLAAASTKELPAALRKKTKTEQAHALGELIAEKAIGLGVKKAVFDRRGYRYHGRVKAVAEGARKKGLAI